MSNHRSTAPVRPSAKIVWRWVFYVLLGITLGLAFLAVRYDSLEYAIWAFGGVLLTGVAALVSPHGSVFLSENFPEEDRRG